MDNDEYIDLEECLASGNHLKDCDDDGYCNACGYQDYDIDALEEVNNK